MAWQKPSGCYRRAGFQGNFAGKNADHLDEVEKGLQEQIANIDNWTEDERAQYTYNSRLLKQYRNDERKARGEGNRPRPTPPPRRGLGGPGEVINPKPPGVTPQPSPPSTPAPDGQQPKSPPPTYQPPVDPIPGWTKPDRPSLPSEPPPSHPEQYPVPEDKGPTKPPVAPPKPTPVNPNPDPVQPTPKPGPPLKPPVEDEPWNPIPAPGPSPSPKPTPTPSPRPTPTPTPNPWPDPDPIVPTPVPDPKPTPLPYPSPDPTIPNPGPVPDPKPNEPWTPPFDDTMPDPTPVTTPERPEIEKYFDDDIESKFQLPEHEEYGDRGDRFDSRMPWEGSGWNPWQEFGGADFDNTIDGIKNDAVENIRNKWDQDREDAVQREAEGDMADWKNPWLN